MATNNVYEWEGDQTQALDNFFWESREFVTPGRPRMSCARVVFTEGDLAAFWASLVAREDIIDRNMARLSSGMLGTTGGAEGGYIHGAFPIAGDNLEEVPALPTYGGILQLKFYLYADGVLKITKDLYTSRIFKLPGGYRALKWKIVLEGNVDKVQKLDVATSVQEILRLQQ